MAQHPAVDTETNVCFDDLTLRMYLCGSTDDELSDRIEQHIDGCETCERNLERVELETQSHPDSVLNSLGTLKTAEPLPEAEGTQHLQDVVQSIKRLPASRSSTDHRKSLDVVVPDRWLGVYELIEPIGRGGMGIVFRANHSKLGKDFAIKVLPSGVPNGLSSIERFEHEVATAGQLQHEAIVQATDAGEENGVSYLVMDLVDGVDIGCLLKHNGPFEIGCAAEIIRQAAVGLEYAHRQGVVHRDIKPSNLMLDKSSRLRILDFGLAQNVAGCLPNGDLTTVGQLLGTLDYMAPEQADASGSVDHRADIYSLGATLYCLLAGRPPHAATPNLSPLEKLRLIATEPPASLSAIRPDVTEELSTFVMSLLSHDRTQRPASAAHVAEAIAPLCNADQLKTMTSELDTVIANRAPIDVTWPPNSSVSPARQSTNPPSRTSWIWKTLVAAGLICGLAYAFIVTVNLNRGQLVIESDAEVTVSVRKDGKAVKQIDVLPGTQSTKLFADKYEISIAAGSDNLSIDRNEFVLKRGETVVARIASVETSGDPTAVATKKGASSGPVYNGMTLDECLRTVKVERDPKRLTLAFEGIAKLSSNNNREQIKNELIGLLLHLDTSRADAEFIDDWTIATLRSVLPQAAFYETIMPMLTGSNWELVSRLARSIKTWEPELLMAISVQLTPEMKKLHEKTFRDVANVLANQLSNPQNSSTVAVQLAHNLALDSTIWFSRDWGRFNNDLEFPQPLVDRIVTESIEEIRKQHFGEHFCMALRLLSSFPNSRLITDSVMDNMVVVFDAAVANDTGKFVDLPRDVRLGTPYLLRNFAPKRFSHISFGSKGPSRGLTPLIALLEYIYGIQRPIPDALLLRVQELAQSRSEATKEIADWQEIKIQVGWPHPKVVATAAKSSRSQTTSRTRLIELTQAAKSQRPKFWYDVAVARAAQNILDQFSDQLESIGSNPQVPATPAAPSSPQITLPAEPSAPSPREVRYNGKTLTECLDTIRWERESVQLSTAFAGLKALANDENRERIAAVIIDTLDDIDGERVQVNGRSYDESAVETLFSILPTQRFREEFGKLVGNGESQTARRIVESLRADHYIALLDDVGTLVDVPKLQTTIAKYLVTITMTQTDAYRNKAAEILATSKTLSATEFWCQVEWDAVQRDMRSRDQDLPKPLVDRILAEMKKVIGDSDSGDTTYCRACSNLERFTPPGELDEDVANLLNERLRELSATSDHPTVRLPNIIAAARVYDPRIRLKANSSHDTTPMFATLCTLRKRAFGDGPLKDTLREMLEARKLVLEELRASEANQIELAWPECKLTGRMKLVDLHSLNDKPNSFWRDVVIAGEIKAILADSESAE
ncbi:MAG: serine/threonine protein kinase [Planctomycetales bacterium]|nr:serine/threonine protein kinase [Planctomycetales bacterium]